MYSKGDFTTSKGKPLDSRQKKYSELISPLFHSIQNHDLKL